jgi:hypothetical protein
MTRAAHEAALSVHWHVATLARPCALSKNGDGMMRNRTVVTWVSFCVVLAMVAGLAWLAIHYLERASF